MKFSVLLIIALKNFWSKRLRAIITVVAVTIGVASILFLLSLGYGLEKMVTSQVVNFDAFTVIDVPSANLTVKKINDNAVATIRQVPHVTTIASSMSLPGRIKVKGLVSTAETVVQANNIDYLKMSSYKTPEGKWFNDDSQEVVINRVLANLLFNEKVKSAEIIGQSMVIDMSIESSMREADLSNETVVITLPPLLIKGVVEEASTPIAYVPIKIAKGAGVTNYTSLKVRIDDKGNVPIARKSLENLGYSTEYVGDTINQISEIFGYFRFILAGFGLIALIVASLGTFNTLTISLLERTREVGLLKVLGMQPKNIYSLFVIESIFIGLAGGILGIMLGYFSGAAINGVLATLANRANVDPVYIFYTPWSLAGKLALFSLLVGFLTGWYPAYRAVKIDALDAIRYE